MSLLHAHTLKGWSNCSLAICPKATSGGGNCRPPGLSHHCSERRTAVNIGGRRTRIQAGLEWTSGSAEPESSVTKFSHKVSLDVPAALDDVWQLWSDIRRAPLWMRWIDAVDILCQDAITVDNSSTLPSLNSLSRWKCSTPGFEVWWVARIQKFEVSNLHRVLQWVTVDGFPNAGEVTFTPSSLNSTRVELTICHSLPGPLARVMTSSALLSLVKATLQSDLERFQEYVCAERTDSLARSSVAASRVSSS